MEATMGDGSSWGSRLLTAVLVAAAALVALKIAAWLTGAVLGLIFFLLFTVVPLAIVGWLVVKLFRIFRGGDEYRPA
jgi:membrane glycosyltransferase